MAKRQRLALQVLDEIFMDSLSEDDEEAHLEEDYSDSAEYSPELGEEVPNELTDTLTSRFVRLQIKVSAFIEPVVQDFVVSAAVFQAVLSFFFATFKTLQLNN